VTKKCLGPATCPGVPWTTAYGTVALSFVIPRACDFFDFCVFGALYQMYFKPLAKPSS